MCKGRATLLATALVVVGTAGLGAAVPAASAATAATAAAPALTACPAGWGSLTKTASSSASTHMPLRGVRTGRQDCFDRLVFDVPGAGTERIGYRVKYVDSFRQDATGNRIPVSGGAILDVTVSAPSYDPESGDQTYPGRGGRALPGVDLTGYRTFRDAKYGVSFEGTTQIGLGVRARLPFRVIQLPDRLVVDVAHNW
jgi:hypothetical protein